MKWRKAVIAAVLLAVPVWVWAQVVANDGSSTRQQTSGMAVGGFTSAETLMRVLRLDDNGNLKTVDASRDRDTWELFPNLIVNQFSTTTATSQDSCAPKLTAPYRQLALVFFPVFDSLSTEVRVAVQVRAHYNSSTDSSSAYPWYRWPRSTLIEGAGEDVDSLGQVTHGPYVYPWTSAGTTSPVWSGEFMVKFSTSRLDSVPASGFGAVGSSPRGIYLPLTDYSGAWYRAPYTSIRVRMVNGIRSRFRLRVEMIGMS